MNIGANPTIPFSGQNRAASARFIGPVLPTLLILSLGACSQAKGLIKFDSNLTGGSSSSSGSSNGSSSSSGESEQKPMARGQGPVWCEGYTPRDSDSNASWTRSYMEREGLSYKTLNYMAMASCDMAGKSEFQQEFAGWKKTYQTTFMVSDNEFAEAMSVYIKEGDAYEALKKEQCDKLKSDEEAAPEVRMHVAFKRYALQCDDDVPQEALWYLDLPKLSELERTVMVNVCVGTRDYDDKDVNPAFAFCLQDMRKLDRKKLDKEIASMKLNLFGRVMLRENFGSAKSRSQKLLAQYDELTQKDEDWKRLVVDAPEAGWKEWMASYEANKAVFESIQKFDAKVRKGSKKALAGCGPELRTHLLTYMKSKKPKDIDEAKAIVVDSVGYPLLVALMTCDASQGRYLEVSTAHSLFLQGLGRIPRGPRHHAYYATLNTLNDIRADRERFPLERLGYLPSGPNTAYQAYEETFNKIQYGNAQGQVESVKPNDDDTVTVTFKAVKWKDPVYKCKRTNRISRIDENGNLIYEENCKRTGYENRSSKESPVVVPKDYAEGLAAGQMLSLSLNEKDGKRIGVPVGVYKDTNKSKFIGLYGVVW